LPGSRKARALDHLMWIGVALWAAGVVGSFW
jgi:hypothetical protein